MAAQHFTFFAQHWHVFRGGGEVQAVPLLELNVAGQLVCDHMQLFCCLSARLIESDSLPFADQLRKFT